jgi:enterochelin esterase-like enzyme
VNADRSVTFNLMNSHAARVEIGGDFRFGRERVGPRQPDVSVPMTKTSTQVWSCTSEPVPPGIYRYFYVVNGLRTLDPLNPWKSYVERGDAYSLVQVRGDTAMPWEMSPEIPHGTIVLEKVYSNILQQLKSCAIYLPAGYSSSGRQYPVLYLLHGAGGNYLEWLFKGYVDNVLDKLFARPNINKYVVVMPEGHVSTPDDHYRTLAARDHATDGVPSFFHANFSEKHVNYFVTDLLPYIEGKYHIAAGKRVIAGLSMGSAQSLNVAMTHPELFQALGVFSGGSLMLEKFRQVGDDLKQINHIYVSCGIYDTLLEGGRELHNAMEAREIPHTYVETDDGGHIWQVWRNALPAFLSHLDARA